MQALRHEGIADGMAFICEASGSRAISETEFGDVARTRRGSSFGAIEEKGEESNDDEGDTSTHSSSNDGYMRGVRGSRRG